MNVFTEPEWQANARLIAAAPKMLNLLQWLDSHMATTTGYSGYSASEAQHKIREAIAEATGESAE
jgi:hypothetical protein